MITVSKKKLNKLIEQIHGCPADYGLKDHDNCENMKSNCSVKCFIEALSPDK